MKKKLLKSLRWKNFSENFYLLWFIHQVISLKLIISNRWKKRILSWIFIWSNGSIYLCIYLQTKERGNVWEIIHLKWLYIFMLNIDPGKILRNDWSTFSFVKPQKKSCRNEKRKKVESKSILSLFTPSLDKLLPNYMMSKRKSSF